MCKAVEEYGQKRENIGRQEGIVESVLKFIKKGKLSYEEIAENFEISVDEVKKLAATI